MKRIVCVLLIAVQMCVTFLSIGESTWTFEYSSRGKGLYRLGNTGYLVENCHQFITSQYLKNIKTNAAQLNENVPLGGNVKKYVYFIESSRSADLNSDLSGENEIYTLIKEQFEADGFATLALEKPEDYLNWFYKTDHHWNYKGSYQGYCDIVRMILGPDEPLAVPAETVTFPDIPFSGAYNSKLGYSKSDEPFTVYRFDNLPEYTALINGSPSKSYGRARTYYTGKYPRLTEYNHYANYYGGDPGELIIDTNQSEKPNLLLISNSYSNAVTHLLAKHFNRIFAIDSRFYKLRMEKDFHIQKYIKTNNIDIVLEMGDMAFFIHSFSLK